MHGSISVVGWKAANEIAMHLLDAGYEVLITTDGEKNHQLDFKSELHLSYTVAFAHPEYEGSYFELVDEFEGARSWDDIKEELKVTGDYPADIAEGLEHLDKECKDCKVKPKKEKK
jgi:hypothetical protein